MSRSYRSRPSELLGIRNDLHAFCLDRAVWTFAMAVETDQQLALAALPKKATEQQRATTAQAVVDVYLNIDPAQVAGRFADPAVKQRGR